MTDRFRRCRATQPRRLEFPRGKARPAYLKLDPAGAGPLAGWDDFFQDGKAAKATRQHAVPEAP